MSRAWRAPWCVLSPEHVGLEVRPGLVALGAVPRHMALLWGGARTHGIGIGQERHGLTEGNPWFPWVWRCGCVCVRGGGKCKLWSAPTPTPLPPSIWG